MLTLESLAGGALPAGTPVCGILTSTTSATQETPASSVSSSSTNNGPPSAPPEVSVNAPPPIPVCAPATPAKTTHSQAVRLNTQTLVVQSGTRPLTTVRPSVSRSASLAPSLADLQPLTEDGVRRVCQNLLWRTVEEISTPERLLLHEEPDEADSMTIDLGACLRAVGGVLGKEAKSHVLECLRRGYPYLVQLVAVRSHGVPTVILFVTVPGMPSCCRVSLYHCDLASIFERYGYAPGVSQERVMVEALVSTELENLQIALVGLVGISCNLVTHSWSYYTYTQVQPSLEVESLVPPCLVGSTFSAWPSTAMMEVVEILERMRDLCLHDPYYEQMCSSFGYQFGQLPDRDSWLFWPNVAEALLCIDSNLDSFVRLLRSGLALRQTAHSEERYVQASKREALADDLEQPRFRPALQVLLTVARPLGEAMLRVATAPDLPSVVAAVLDLLNCLRAMLYGETVDPVELVCWDALFDSLGTPLTYAQVDTPLPALRGGVANRLMTTDVELAGMVRRCASDILEAWLIYWRRLLESRAGRGALLPLLRVASFPEHEGRITGWVKEVALTPVLATGLVDADLIAAATTRTFGEAWRDGSITADGPFGIALSLALLSHR